jgi:uncharacterized membrane protein (GlpM family)
MSDLVLRFVLGGAVVTAFALLADVLRPKSFAGLFGAAPSVALATLSLTVQKEGKLYASIEARSMVLGAIGFLLYAVCVSWMLRRYKTSTLATTMSFMPVWFISAFALVRIFGLETR